MFEHFLSHHHPSFKISTPHNALQDQIDELYEEAKGTIA